MLFRSRPVWLLVSLFIIFPISVTMIVLRGNGVQFFPKGDPNFIYVYLKMPVGTDIKTTDSVTRLLEDKVHGVLGKDQPGAPGSIVESVIANVAVSANNPRDNNRSTQPNLGRIQVSFVEFEKRHGKLTRPYMDAMREAVKGIPGTEISVNQEDMGPPTEAPVNIEVIGEDFESIARVAFDLKNYLDTNKVEGVEALNLDVDPNNPEISVIVDREKVLAEGLSTGFGIIQASVDQLQAGPLTLSCGVMLSSLLMDPTPSWHLKHDERPGGKSTTKPRSSLGRPVLERLA